MKTLGGAVCIHASPISFIHTFHINCKHNYVLNSIFCVVNNITNSVHTIKAGVFPKQYNELIAFSLCIYNMGVSLWQKE